MIIPESIVGKYVLIEKCSKTTKFIGYKLSTPVLQILL